MVNKKNIRKGKQEKPTRIVVECVYLGGQSMEDAFRKINEETVKVTFHGVGKSTK